MDSQKNFERTFSFEFFPPKTPEGAEKLAAVRDELGALNPRYFSVTFGAGGSTQKGTLETVLAIQAAGYTAAPHLSCIGSEKQTISDLLQTYIDNDIRHLVALRGDIPSGMQGPGEFNYANELVAFIREQTGDHFHIEVAAYPEFHPQAESAQVDLENFKRKVDAGADSALTQYFYNANAYFRFVDSCEQMGIAIPIVPGIMPITNYTQLARFSDACGAELPRWIRKRLQSFGDDKQAIIDFGLDVVGELCETLLAAGTPGLHFYTMNRTEPTLTLWKNLGL
jgi:methylenetetrahydrofolate reductase (NADPH)